MKSLTRDRKKDIGAFVKLLSGRTITPAERLRAEAYAEARPESARRLIDAQLAAAAEALAAARQLVDEVERKGQALVERSHALLERVKPLLNDKAAGSK